jgi:hypothetical protein
MFAFLYLLTYHRWFLSLIGFSLFIRLVLVNFPTYYGVAIGRCKFPFLCSLHEADINGKVPRVQLGPPCKRYLSSASRSCRSMMPCVEWGKVTSGQGLHTKFSGCARDER